MSSEPFRILVVCTGNVCRSSAAELLLARELADLPGIIVRSAGTRAMPGDTVPEPMASLLRDRGLDADRHAATRLTERIVAGADLVLGATRRHRSAAVELHPGALRRAFTLTEFARLVGRVAPDDVAARVPAGSPAERLRVLVELTLPLRGGSTPEADDIDDPVNRSREFNDQVLHEIEHAIATIARAARG